MFRCRVVLEFFFMWLTQGSPGLSSQEGFDAGKGFVNAAVYANDAEKVMARKLSIGMLGYPLSFLTQELLSPYWKAH